MKKYLKIILVILLSAGIIVSCKKEDAKDYAASIKDKTWWGQLTYANTTAEYYSVHFNADNSLLWSQKIGDYAGHWALDGKQLTITFSVSSVEIKADISKDDRLVNITDNTASSEINSGQLIPNPKLSLDNTVWKGTYPTSPYEISFLSSSKMTATFANSSYTSTYSRSLSGALIRWSFAGSPIYFMGVITSDNEMKGGDDRNTLWQLVKQ